MDTKWSLIFYKETYKLVNLHNIFDPRIFSFVYIPCMFETLFFLYQIMTLVIPLVPAVLPQREKCIKILEQRGEYGHPGI